VRLLNYEALAVDELRSVLPHGDALAILARALGDLGMTQIEGEDSLRSVGAHLLKQGGATAVAGALLVLIAGRTAPSSAMPSMAEPKPMRFPRPIDNFNPSASDIAVALNASESSGKPET
jgi:hypothetical protein